MTPATPDRARAAAEADGLLPCPFCGCKEPSLSLGKMGDGRPFRYVECDGCGAAGAGDPSYTDEQATLQWNRRAPASRSATAGGEAPEWARHTHKPVTFGSEECAVCGENFRSHAHLRVGENGGTVEAALRRAAGAAP